MYIYIYDYRCPFSSWIYQLAIKPQNAPLSIRLFFIFQLLGRSRHIEKTCRKIGISYSKRMIEANRIRDPINLHGDITNVNLGMAQKYRNMEWHSNPAKQHTKHSDAVRTYWIRGMPISRYSKPKPIQWEFQDPKMEVLYHIRPYFVWIFPYIGPIYGRYLQWIGSWNGHWPMKPMTGKLWKAGNYRKQRPNHRTGIRTWTMMDNNQWRCHANWIDVKFSKWWIPNTSQRPWVSVLKWSNLDNLGVPPF